MVNSWYNIDIYFTNMESIKIRNHLDSLLRYYVIITLKFWLNSYNSANIKD